MFDYLREPDAIRRESTLRVRAATDLGRLPPALHATAIRLVHACAMPEVVAELAWGGDPVATGRAALAAGAPLLCDCEMLASGVTRAALPRANRVTCALRDPGVAERARAEGITRSAAAVDSWDTELGGALVAIGNAPTALFRLLERLAGGAPAPACILAFPVGFVGAAESKLALIEQAGAIPYLTLRGRLGGSALAAAAVNSLGLGAP